MSSQPNPEASEPNLQGHMPVLDGVRGIAILMVMIFHSTRIRATAPIDDTYFLLGRSMWLGVDLFFVLSGFLITGILFDSKRKKGFFKNFYMRRALRIFPLYYLVVAFCIYIAPNLPFFEQMRPNPGKFQWWYWLYGSNFLAAREGLSHVMLGPTWSLAIEEQFYIVWPFLVFLLSRKSMMFACLAIIIFSALLRIFLFLEGYSATTIYVLTPTRLDPLAAGAFVALAARGKGGIRALLPWAYGVGIVSGAMVLYLLVNGYLNKKIWWMIYYGYSAAAIFFACMLVVLVALKSGSLLHRVFSGRVISSFGKYSYALYLVNRVLVGFVAVYIFEYRTFPRFAGSSIPGQVIFTVIVIAFSFVLAFLSWHLFEKHILKLKKWFPTKKSSQAVASSS